MQSDKNIPPDVQIERDAVTIRCGERETVATKDGIRIRERCKSHPASRRLVRLLSANFTNPETVLRLEYERGDKMQLLRTAMTWDVYHGAVPEIEAMVRSEEAFDELWQAIKKMSRQRVRRGGSRIEYSIKLVS